MIIEASNFSTRAELEAYVNATFGLTTEAKDHTIHGTDEELAKLQLSTTTMFWGMRCVN